MKVEGYDARKVRKLRASRDLWKQRSAEKQQQIRQLRVTVRDLSTSREHWKKRVKDLEQQLHALRAAQDAHSAIGPGIGTFWGGLMARRVTPQTCQTPLSWPNA